MQYEVFLIKIHVKVFYIQIWLNVKHRSYVFK